MTQANHHQIATYLTDYALSELVRYVMEDTGCGWNKQWRKSIIHLLCQLYKTKKTNSMSKALPTCMR